jgi:hypothetical protein
MKQRKSKEALSQPFVPEQDVLDAVESLMDTAIRRHHDTRSDEILTECRVCGLWEEHEVDCPVPAIEKWWRS